MSGPGSLLIPRKVGRHEIRIFQTLALMQSKLTQATRQGWVDFGDASWDLEYPAAVVE